MNFYKTFFKAFIDFFMALIILIISSPLILITALTLAVFNDGEVFFFQKRPGINKKPFILIKFKTMRDLYDSKGKLLSDTDRITKVGSIIRIFSIDEILQLINVLKGDMSIVGPRPLLMKYLERYSEFQNQRHDVKPGITGLAQINGRNNLSWEDKFKYDVIYVKNQSFILDIKILLKTFVVVLRQKGVNQNEEITMEEFKGNSNA
ncbi:sugar transferase [Flavobacteriaceae bacterium]|nr:sugar transferase [Flavobacteriaceae bacterium]